MESSLPSHESQDSGIETSMEASFRAASRRLFESTPKVETVSSSPCNSNNLKKRKRGHIDPHTRLNNLVESCPSTPQFSSTLNDSALATKFNDICLQESYYFTDTDERVSKHFKKEKSSATPENQILHIESTPKKPGHFSKCPTNLIAASPMKEKQDLLYPSIALKTPVKKPPTPQKFRERLEKFEKIEELKKIEEENLNKSENFEYIDKLQLWQYARFSSITAFDRCISNGTIMTEIFNHLSDGDIFRFAKVNSKCQQAVFSSPKAKQRHHEFLSRHKINKENYTITPPSSPEQCFLGPSSPNSQKFRSFMDLSSKLRHYQSLVKCPNCSEPSIVENSIAQCQKASCGYIFCQKCNSFAYSPAKFVDKCQSSDLVLTPYSGKKQRVGLLHISTNSLHDSLTLSPIMHSTIYHTSTSGYESIDATQSPMNVKRNLSKSFASNGESTKTPLFDMNRSVAKTKSTKAASFTQNSLASVVVKATVKKVEHIPEPSSPPRIKPYAACSKQSRRNLKRLTR